MVGAARVPSFVDHGTAPHGWSRAGMGYRHEGLVGIVNEGGGALDLADPVDQPVAVHLQARATSSSFSIPGRIERPRRMS